MLERNDLGPVEAANALRACKTEVSGLNGRDVLLRAIVPLGDFLLHGVGQPLVDGLALCHYVVGDLCDEVRLKADVRVIVEVLRQLRKEFDALSAAW